MSAPFEKPTDELRQGREKVDYLQQNHHWSVGTYTEQSTVDVVISIQRKWLVQDGPDHFDTVPDWKRQWEWLPQIDANHYSDRGDGRVGRFCYLKEEWRDLPLA